jgi:adenylate cyclase
MQTLVHASTAATLQQQEQVRNVAVALTALAAVLGLGFAFLVSGGVMRPVLRLVAGARAVEAGRLDQTLPVTSKDEIGQLTGVFNGMVEQLRLKERIRETFGKYIDPQVVEGLIDRPALGTSGQRRVMTVMFCDLKGFTSVSEGMTPQGLVKIMNRYLTTMSEAIRNEHGVIDKYIGDAIMAYWGPPFNDDAEQAKLACFAATDMAARLVPLRAELPDLLGVRKVPMLDIRIGIATGEVLVGSIGSDLTMSYTVMGEP